MCGGATPILKHNWRQWNKLYFLGLAITGIDIPFLSSHGCCHFKNIVSCWLDLPILEIPLKLPLTYKWPSIPCLQPLNLHECCNVLMFLFNLLCYCYILDYFLPLQHFFNWCFFIFISNNNCCFLFALNVLPFFYGISIFFILLYFLILPL
jgi:hypothetical protein